LISAFIGKQISNLIKNEKKDITGLILVLLGHGYEKNGKEFVLCEDGRGLSVKAIEEMFSNANARNLIGSPKVVVIDAYRGARRYMIPVFKRVAWILILLFTISFYSISICS
jgi:hypothetical protein